MFLVFILGGNILNTVSLQSVIILFQNEEYDYIYKQYTLGNGNLLDINFGIKTFQNSDY